jgi:hypothetical protein
MIAGLTVSGLMISWAACKTVRHNLALDLLSADLDKNLMPNL